MRCPGRIYMSKKMLMNATQHEENRVAIVEDGILTELDIEVAGHEPTKRNLDKLLGMASSVAGSPIPLARSIPGAEAVVVPGRSHLSVINDAFFKGAVLGFLGDRRD